MFEHLYRITAAWQVKQISAMMPFESGWTVLTGFSPIPSISERLDFRLILPVDFSAFPCVFKQFCASILTIQQLYLRNICPFPANPNIANPFGDGPLHRPRRVETNGTDRLIVLVRRLRTRIQISPQTYICSLQLTGPKLNTDPLHGLVETAHRGVFALACLHSALSMQHEPPALVHCPSVDGHSRRKSRSHEPPSRDPVIAQMEIRDSFLALAESINLGKLKKHKKQLVRILVESGAKE